MENTVEETNSLSDNVQSDIEELEKDIAHVQNLIQQADLTLKILEPEYGKHFLYCENNIDNEYIYLNAKINDWQVLLNKIINILNNSVTFLNTIRIFASNYLELLYEKEMILDAGADLYLPKPYELKDLFMWINKLID